MNTSQASTNPALPPPLPADMRPNSSFVSVLAWISIALALLGLLYGVMQVLMGALLPSDFYLRMANPYGAPVQLPPLMHWIYTHTLVMGVAMVVLSALFLWVSWGLLKRHEWGRKGFIAILAVGTLWQFGCIWALPQLLEGTLAMQAGAFPQGQAMPPELEGMMTGVMIMGGVLALVFAALHAWIIWKLCAPAVRIEFHK
ncbi:MAG TPA: hypothetical protein VET30_02600 [Pseudoxanthomonas sp.]|nr:hypothetical protein [Pseudoxanthomonas sp.]